MKTSAVARSDCRRLWVAVLATGLFLVSVAIQGALRPDFDAWQQAVSALSLGPGGWAQNASFIMLGGALLTTVPVWRRVLAGGKGERTYPLLTALTGLSLTAVAFIPQDPAPGYDPEQLGHKLPTAIGLIHLALAGVGASTTCAALFVMASRFAVLPDWREWVRPTQAAAAVTIVCVIVYAVWSTKAAGFAGTFERMVVIIPGVWGYLMLKRLSSGVPFVVSAA